MDNSDVSENSDYNYDENVTQDISQEPMPQQFFEKLDNDLFELPREYYVSELLKYCLNSYTKINAYRERLAERARDLPG